MALPTLTTPDRVLHRIANALSRDVAQMEPVWAERAAQSIDDATSKIVRTLAAKGYTAAQITGDPGTSALCTRLAACYALVEAGPSGGHTESVDKALERYEKELADWPPIQADASQAAGQQVVAGGMIRGWDDEQARYGAMGTGRGYLDANGNWQYP